MAVLTDEEVLALDKIIVRNNEKAKRIRATASSRYGSSYDFDEIIDIADIAGKPRMYKGAYGVFHARICAVIDDILYLEVSMGWRPCRRPCRRDCSIGRYGINDPFFVEGSVAYDSPAYLTIELLE